MTCTHRPIPLLAVLGAGAMLLAACAASPGTVEATETTRPNQFSAQDRAFLVNLDDTFTHVDTGTLTATAVHVCDEFRQGRTMDQVLVVITNFVKFVEPGLSPGDTASQTVDFLHAATNAYCPER